MLYAFSASSDGVVALCAGTLNRWIDPIDSPSRSRMRAAAALDACEHVGLGRRLRLLAGERVAGAARLRFERDDVGRGERRNRAEHDRP